MWFVELEIVVRVYQLTKAVFEMMTKMRHKTDHHSMTECDVHCTFKSTFRSLGNSNFKPFLCLQQMPGLQSFCVCTAIALGSIYVLQLTWFTAWLVIDERRRAANR